MYKIAKNRRKTYLEEIITGNFIKKKCRTGNLLFVNQKLEVIFVIFNFLWLTPKILSSSEFDVFHHDQQLEEKML